MVTSLTRAVTARPQSETMMTTWFLLVAIVLILAMTLLILFRRPKFDVSAIVSRLESMEKAGDRVERSVREEASHGREEFAAGAHQGRQELAAALKDVGNSLQSHLQAISELQLKQLTVFGERIDRLTGS